MYSLDSNPSRKIQFRFRFSSLVQTLQRTYRVHVCCSRWHGFHLRVGLQVRVRVAPTSLFVRRHVHLYNNDMSTTPGLHVLSYLLYTLSSDWHHRLAALFWQFFHPQLHPVPSSVLAFGVGPHHIPAACRKVNGNQTKVVKHVFVYLL